MVDSVGGGGGGGAAARAEARAALEEELRGTRSLLEVRVRVRHEGAARGQG